MSGPAGAAAGRANPAGPAVRAAGVVRRFGSFTAVDGVDVRVEPGEVVGLLGANGAGKTTLIRMVLGLLDVTAGVVDVFGAAPSRESRRRIGYVPQGLGLYDDLTVAENLDFTAAAFGVPRTDPADDDVAAASGTLIADLPLGLRRRTAFAAALGHQPDLLVLDEPTSGVDPLGRARLWDLVRSTADQGAAVLVSTHYMEEAQNCDRLVVMAAGRVVAEGTLADVVGSQMVVEVLAPQWESAFTALRDAGLPVGLRGRRLRVSAEPEVVTEVLRQADVRCEIAVVPASFEEAFVRLASSGAGQPTASGSA